MAVTTTYASGGPRKKPFTWSYSRLKNFEACPKKHWEVDIAKTSKEEEGEQLMWGNEVHKVMAKRLRADKIPLPVPMRMYEHWCQKLEATPGEIIVEQKLAIDRDFGPRGFFNDGVWFRSIADVIKINGPVALLADWKTGKIMADSVQLALGAAVVFAHYPSIHMIRSQYIWLKEDAESHEDFKRSDMPAMWRTLWPRIEALEKAHDEMNYPPKPGGLCARWCPVTKCPHNGS